MIYLPNSIEWEFWVEVCSKEDDPVFGLDGLMVRWPTPPEIDAFTEFCQRGVTCTEGVEK